MILKAQRLEKTSYYGEESQEIRSSANVGSLSDGSILWLPTDETPIAEAALRYTEHGFVAIPVAGVDAQTWLCTCGKEGCGATGKHPLVGGWQNLRPDVARVRKQFLRAFLGANVGLVMGGHARLVAFDIDGPEGYQALAGIEKDLGALPETLVSRSGRQDGGEHRIYYVPDEFDLAAIKNRPMAPKVDLRATAGQIVVAPSMHKSGRRYRWVTKGPIAALPAAWYERMASKPGKKPWPMQRDKLKSAVASGMSPFAVATLRSACESIRSAPEGDRNNIFNKQVYGVAGLVSSGQMEETLSRDTLCDAARSAGLDEDEIEKTFASAFAAGAAKPRNVQESSIASTAHERTAILVDTDEGRMVDQTIAAIQTREDLYQRGGMLVRVLVDAQEKGGIRFANGSPRIAPLPASLLREMCSRSARYYSIHRSKRDGELVERDEHPPGYTVEQVLARGNWEGIRPLTGVIEHPVLRPDGTVLQTPGYDTETGLLYLPSANFCSVIDRPTLAEAQSAAATLLELVAEFPFVEATHKTGWLASVLTLFARFSFEGCTPMFLVDAGAAGSGKSLLASLVSVIATGRDMPRMVPSDDDEEMRKRLLTIAIAGARAVLLDNVTGRLGGAALNMVITSTVIEDRILGRNELVTVPWMTVLYGTANNAKVADDTHRRTIYQRLEAEAERPEDREGFKIPDLLTHAKKHRAKLVNAVLTILRAYAVYRSEGGAPPSMRTMGSFGAWSDAVRAPIVWLGLPDPHLATVEWRDQNDTSLQNLGGFLRGWKELCSNVGRDAMTAYRALQHLAANDAEREAWRFTADRREPEPPRRWVVLREAIEALTGNHKLPDSRKLGDILRGMKGRVVGGHRLVTTGFEYKVALWKVEKLVEPSQMEDGERTRRDSTTVPLSEHGCPRGHNPPDPGCGHCGAFFNDDGSFVDA